ncbi:hypothetical protein WDU94_005842 [Cyamophila willieti]
MANTMTEEQQNEMMKTQINTFKEFLLQYNKITEICFKDCINHFIAREVTKKEESCAVNCLEKYMKMTSRISQRMQEFQMLQNEQALAGAGGVKP